MQIGIQAKTYIYSSEKAKNTKIFQQQNIFNKYSTIKHINTTFRCHYNLFMYVYNICKLVFKSLHILHTYMNKL